MKKVLFFIAAPALLLANACKEIGPAIDFSVATDSDTTYMEASVPAADPKKVLIEESTGVQCTNCPDGVQTLKTYDQAHPDRIIIAALHSGLLATPIPGESQYDFRNEKVKNLIIGYFGGNPPQPSIAIDRVKQDNAYFITSRTKWGNYIDQRAAVPAPVNIKMTSTYSADKREAVITVKVTYTQQVTKIQNLNVWIAESNIVDVQINSNIHDFNYVHNHVIRDFLTPQGGATIANGIATKEPGRVYERTFVYKVNDAWKAENCNVIAFVNNDEQDDKAVAQVAEIALKP